MTEPITEKQLVYMNIILSETFQNYRKLYLKLFYGVDTSKDLTRNEASEIIERFHEENEERDKNIAIAMEKIYEHIGQKNIFGETKKISIENGA